MPKKRTEEEHEGCLCSNTKEFEHRVKRLAGALIHARRRFLLKDFRGLVLEGRLEYRTANGETVAIVDHTNVNSVLHDLYKEGERIRIVVMPVGDEDLANEDWGEDPTP